MVFFSCEISAHKRLFTELPSSVTVGKVDRLDLVDQ